MKILGALSVTVTLIPHSVVGGLGIFKEGGGGLGVLTKLKDLAPLRYITLGLLPQTRVKRSNAPTI